MLLLLKALVMGVVEGLTEFLPVSSTAHLILAGEVLNYPEAGRVTMEIFIQVGAILAVVWYYRAELTALATQAGRDPAARALPLKLLVAFVPAAVAGLLLHHAIEEHLFTPASVAAALILGGIVILVVEARHPQARTNDVMAIGWRESLLIGLAQVTSLVPGVSRAGATIIGGLLVGLGRPAATQFSFYLAIPTVGAASVYSLAQAVHHGLLTADDASALAVGLVAAFVSALVVIQAFLAYVRRHDFTVFAYYRIAVGILVYMVLGAAVLRR